MKNQIISIIILCFGILACKAQNPAYYQQHPTKNNVKWYYQLNTEPVIIKNGVIVSENNEPNWYRGFQFVLCPGIFNTVNEAYSYLHSDPELLESDNNSYYNRKNPSQHTQHINSFKEILKESKAYASNEEAKKDANVYVLSGCREKVVFSELYLKLDTTEMVMLQAGAMYLTGKNSNSTVDIKEITDAMIGKNVDESKNYGVEYTVLIKEDGKWKYADTDKLDIILGNYLTDFSFMQNASKYPRVIVESTVNSFGNRTYTIGKQNTLFTNFTTATDGWVANGAAQTKLENGKLKVTVDKEWEGIRREIKEFSVSPGDTFNVTVNFDKSNTKAAIRLYFQEIDAAGKHLSWNVINGDLQSGISTHQHTVKAGRKLILRIDKTNTHLNETTNFYVDQVTVTKK